MQDYHDSYLKCDVLLLTDDFEKFRNSIWKIYGLYLRYYLSASALRWDAMVNMKKIEH